MGAYRFSMAPNISVPRSKFKMPFNHVTSFNHGKLVPIDCFEILPGDEFKCDLSAVIRMSTPIAPIFGNIKAHVHAFFVPMRLVWEHTKEFYGENKTSAGYQQQAYTIPSSKLGSSDFDDIAANSISAYLGKPVMSEADAQVTFSILKERCVCLCWNEYYRAQQLQNPILISTGDTGAVGTYTDGNDDNPNSTLTKFDGKTTCFNVCKEFDYFTACTVSPQYGSAVTLPLGTNAPLKIIDKSYNIGGDLKIASNYSYPTTASYFNLYSFHDDQASANHGKISIASNSVIQNTWNNRGVSYLNLVADLSNATAASINSIRYAFQVQKWLERANFGSRFFEMLNLHYGVTSPDARLQRPEYLGGFDFYINVDQVVATATATDGTGSSQVGQTGAVSVTGIKGRNLFHKAFVEPGYVLVFVSTTHERLYCQGLMREDTRKDRFDFYFPEFANLGDQTVLSKEIFFNDDLSSVEDYPFGYQEHWAEYRYRANRVSGLMNPNVANALDYWTLAERFASRPTLSNLFIMEDRKAITDALVSGSSGPDYIADFYFDYTAIREMPLYTIPGLVDHFGTM